MTPALRLTDLHSYYGKSHILQGVTLEVGPGDAILTRSGDSHALRQRGREDLVIFIVFDDSRRTP